MRETQRHGSVLVLVVAILTLLFIVGAALLAVSNLDRKATEDARRARDLREAQKTLVDHVLKQLRDDVVGTDGIPYSGQ